jgi:hypothetical protein
MDMGYLIPVPMWKSNRANNKEENKWFYEHTIGVDPSVGRYIDHVLRSKKGSMILNPASHLRLHHNLEDGYFKEIKFVFKLTCNRSEDP